MPVFAIKGEDADTYHRHIMAALDHRPHLLIDDGADVVTAVHTSRKEVLAGIIGGTEETTTGIIRDQAMEKDGTLAFPIIAVNDADTKHFFDNRYGTGPEHYRRHPAATNLLLAGKVAVVAGFGWCGKGLAMRLRGMGCQVIVTEIDPVKALEAGHGGLPRHADGRGRAARRPLRDRDRQCQRDRHCHFEAMKDGAMLANSGHFDSRSTSRRSARWPAKGRRTLRPFVEEFKIAGDKSLIVLGEGRLINLASAEGHPPA
jgi:adenosylhomocysteinase